MRASVPGILVLVLLLNAAVWTLLNLPGQGESWTGRIQGLSYSPYGRQGDPQAGDTASPDQIRHDMDILARSTRSVRTYSTLNGADHVPALTAGGGLKVMAGAWIGRDTAANNEEIARLVTLANTHASVWRVTVGNETLLRGDVTVDQLVDYIRKVRRQVSVPVSTAETWDVWLKYPRLADEVDFITIHILPYWEAIPADQAMDHVRSIWSRIRERFPEKHVVLGETGWPSDGAWQQGAEASRINQARFVREFLNFATQEKIDYYLMEAFDQPWKAALEGSAGAHWGLFDADRKPKFAMTGSLTETPEWPWLCALSAILALGPVLAFLVRRRDLRRRGLFFYALMIQGAVSMLVWALAHPVARGQAPGTSMAWAVLAGFQIILLAVMLIDALELTEVVWTRHRRRHFVPAREPLPDRVPKVSIHVPCYNEPPVMVKATLDALARLDWPDFEVLVIDNNTRDEAVWRPLEEYCQVLGPRFRFFHLPQWPGYKAGALNFGLSQTAPDAEIIGVIDSDYQVTPDWLRSTVPFFARPEVGFVQSPQDYRDWRSDPFRVMCNWEYQGFFHIGMIQRNERNAIIQHGTMTLIRRPALEKLKWAEWCICEDAELGLRLFQEGYEAVYMPDSFGQGLVPDSFSAYKSQRWRWAYGAVQILKRHWRELLPVAGKLTAGQKYHFITGWLPWFADAAHLVFAAGAIIWSAGLLMPAVTETAAMVPGPGGVALAWLARSLTRFFEFPPAAFMLPTVTVFGFKVLGSLWLYAERVKCTFMDK
nr:glycosyltransferase [Pseudomonadota bacterium]